MWGLLFFAVLGIGGFIYSCKNDAEDTRDRQKRREEGEAYYFDHIGRQRRVDNNHQVMRAVQRNGTYRDDVMMDMKTGQVLHNYSNDKRQERMKWEQEQQRESNKRREAARAAGKYSYRTCKEPPITCGLYDDLHSYPYSQDPLYIETYHYAYHDRRVSDNLLMKGSCNDARCGFVLFNEEAEKNNDIEWINKHVDWNWRIINNWDNECRYSWRENTPYPTAAEVEKYAREIGAYLDKREIIKEEKPRIGSDVIKFAFRFDD